MLGLSHVLRIGRWSHAAAWAVTELVLRTGLRSTMHVPRRRIVTAARRDWRRRFGTGKDELSLAVIGEPDVALEALEREAPG